MTERWNLCVFRGRRFCLRAQTSRPSHGWAVFADSRLYALPGAAWDPAMPPARPLMFFSEGWRPRPPACFAFGECLLLSEAVTE